MKDNNKIASIVHKNIHGYLSLDIICSSKLTVFLKLRRLIHLINFSFIQPIMNRKEKRTMMLVKEITKKINCSHFQRTHVTLNHGRELLNIFSLELSFDIKIYLCVVQAADSGKGLTGCQLYTV